MPGKLGAESKLYSKYSFINRTIRLWNQLHAEALGTLSCEQSTFRKRTQPVLIKVFCSFPQCIKGEAGIAPPLGHDCFFQNTF
jgi:hypothetical protein